jgi:hypothetical protein
MHKKLEITHVIKKIKLRMKIRIASKNPTATLAHNSPGYRTYWQGYGVNIIISFGVLD